MIFFCHKKISKMFFFFFLLQENCKKIFLNRQKNLTRFCCNKGTLKKGKVNLCLRDETCTQQGEYLILNEKTSLKRYKRIFNIFASWNSY